MYSKEMVIAWEKRARGSLQDDGNFIATLKKKQNKTHVPLVKIINIISNLILLFS